MTRTSLLLVSLSLTGCVDSTPDYTPIGEGMKALGICLVCCAVVGVLGTLVKREKP
jgi:hypothetical protein